MSDIGNMITIFVWTYLIIGCVFSFVRLVQWYKEINQAVKASKDYSQFVFTVILMVVFWPFLCWDRS